MRLLFILLSFILTDSVCHADYFSARLPKVDWEFKQGDSYCQLKQDIPLYGMTDFMHQSGELLRFSIKENRFKPPIVKASLTIENSSWRHQAKPEKEYLVNLDHAIDIQNYPRLSVYGETAEQMLDALLKGLSPTFNYKRNPVNELSKQTHVAVSAVKFSKKYQQFAECRKDFLPHGFKNTLEKIIFFKPGSRSLSPEVLQQLENTVRYVNEIKGSEVVIVSETEIAGKQDKVWFSKRAGVIIAKLNELGLAKNKVNIKRKIDTALLDRKVIQLGIFGSDALKTIYYRKGNVKLTETEKKRLTVLAKYADEFLPDSKIIIRSHTDSKGSRANNFKISQKRGDVIKQYLVSIGVDEKKVKVKAYGESRPVRINRFETGRAQNRRVNIDFSG